MSLLVVVVRVLLRKCYGRGRGLGLNHLYPWRGSVKTHCTFDDIYDEKQHDMAQAKLEEGDLGYELFEALGKARRIGFSET